MADFIDFKDATSAIVTEIKRMVEKAVEAASFDRTYRGRVVAIESGKCSVLINGTIYTLKTFAGYTVGDYVNVLVPRNNWNNATILGGTSLASTVYLAPADKGTIVNDIYENNWNVDNGEYGFKTYEYLYIPTNTDGARPLSYWLSKWDLPYQYCIIFVHRVSSTQGVALGMGINGYCLKINYLNNGTWAGWKEVALAS